MNLKDKTFLGKFCILIALENFGTRDFSIKGRLGWSSTHQSKMRKSLTIRVLSTKYLQPPNKSLTPLVMLLEIEH